MVCDCRGMGRKPGKEEVTTTPSRACDGANVVLTVMVVVLSISDA